LLFSPGRIALVFLSSKLFNTFSTAATSQLRGVADLRRGLERLCQKPDGIHILALLV
jgi:hypothetical protein